MNSFIRASNNCFKFSKNVSIFSLWAWTAFLFLNSFLVKSWLTSFCELLWVKKIFLNEKQMLDIVCRKISVQRKESSTFGNLQSFPSTLTYLDGFLDQLGKSASIWCVLPMDSTKEVQLDCMLGHPVLELVKELTAPGQTQAPLIELFSKQRTSY